MKPYDRRIEVPIMFDEGMEQLIGCMVPVPGESHEPAESPWSRWGAVGLLAVLAVAAAVLVGWG